MMVYGILKMFDHNSLCAFWKPGYSLLHFVIHAGSLHSLATSELYITFVVNVNEVYILPSMNSMSVSIDFCLNELFSMSNKEL